MSCRVWFPMYQTHSCVTKIILKVALPCWLSVYKVSKLCVHLFPCSYLRESHELLETHKLQVTPCSLSPLRVGAQSLQSSPFDLLTSQQQDKLLNFFFSDQRCSMPSLNQQVSRRKNELICDLSVNSIPCSPTSPARILCFQFLLKLLNSFTW